MRTSRHDASVQGQAWATECGDQEESAMRTMWQPDGGEHEEGCLSKTTVDMRTHAPACRSSSLKCAFAVGVLDEMRQRCFDVEGTYLQGVYVDRRVFARAPAVYRKYDERGLEMV